jgi:hypothetical protein
MEQVHNILLSRFFTATTTTFGQSDLKVVNSYYLTQEGSTNKIVDEYNVRGFLSHEKNQKVVTSFFVSLTGNPVMNEAFYSSNGMQFIASPSFKEIYYNDEKLAQTFNDYYNNSIVRGKEPTVASSLAPKFVENQLLNLEGQDFYYENFIQSPNYFTWDSHAIMEPKYLEYIPLDFNHYNRNSYTEEVMVKKPKGENYLINVFLQRTVSQTSREIFELCDTKIIKSISEGNIIFFNQLEPGIQNDILTTTGLQNPYLNNLNVSATNVSELSTGIISYNVDPNTVPQQENEFGRIALIGALDILNQNSSFMETRSTFTEESGSTSGTNQIVQCFIDLNLNTNENEYYFSRIPKVSFELHNLVVYEGAEFTIRLVLSQPAIGNESVVVKWAFSQGSMQPSDFEYGVTTSLEKTYYFSEGDEYITIDPIKVSQDNYKYPPRVFSVSLENLFNLAKGSITQLKLKAIDTTNWRDITFQPTGEIEHINSIPYVINNKFIYSQSLITGGTFFPVNIILNEPSQYGIENFSISFDVGTTFNLFEQHISMQNMSLHIDENPDWHVWWQTYSSTTQTLSNTISAVTLTSESIGMGGNNIFYGSNCETNRNTFTQNITFQPGEQKKTLIFQFFSNADLFTGTTEYFDIKITNLNFVDPGEYLNTRVYMQDNLISGALNGQNLSNSISES